MSTIFHLIEAEKSASNLLTIECVENTLEELNILRLDLNSGIRAVAQLMFSTTGADTNLMNDLGCLHLLLNELAERYSSNEATYREFITLNNKVKGGDHENAQNT